MVINPKEINYKEFLGRLINEQKKQELLVEQFKKDSDYRFIIDVRNYLTKKLGKLEFPEEKLKKLMLANARR